MRAKRREQRDQEQEWETKVRLRAEYRLSTVVSHLRLMSCRCQSWTAPTDGLQQNWKHFGVRLPTFARGWAQVKLPSSCRSKCDRSSAEQPRASPSPLKSLVCELHDMPDMLLYFHLLCCHFPACSRVGTLRFLSVTAYSCCLAALHCNSDTQMP